MWGRAHPVTQLRAMSQSPSMTSSSRSARRCYAMLHNVMVCDAYLPRSAGFYSAKMHSVLLFPTIVTTTLLSSTLPFSPLPLHPAFSLTCKHLESLPRPLPYTHIAIRKLLNQDHYHWIHVGSNCRSEGGCAGEDDVGW